MEHGRAYYIRTHFPHILLGLYIAELAKALEGCRTCLDIGCGVGSPLRFVPTNLLVGVDGHLPSVETARLNKTHDEVHHADVRTVGERFSAGQFDACVGLDLIEHLPKEDGLKLLEQMEKIASRRVVLFTPNGFLPQKGQDGDLQEHLSGWEVAEMCARGYDVIGLYGPKLLRGEGHKVKFLFRPIGNLASLAVHILYTRSHPEYASALLCVKSLD